MVEPRRVAPGIDQHEMIVDRVERIAFEPILMVHQRPVATQFRHENLVAQALRGDEIGLASGEADHELRRLCGHGHARSVLGSVAGL